MEFALATGAIDVLVITAFLIGGLGLFWLSIYKGRPINSENVHG